MISMRKKNIVADVPLQKHGTEKIPIIIIWELIP